MKKQWFKQATAILMAMILAVSCPLLSLAADTIPEETMTFYVRAENDAGTILPRTKVTMKASDHKALSEYGVQGTPPEIAYITPMEVFCYALSQYTGGEYTTADLKLGSGGWISDFFGAGANTLWFMDGIDAPTMSTAVEAKDGEEYVFIEANMDSGICFTGFGFFGELEETTGGYNPYQAKETSEATLRVGEELELTYNACGSMMMGQDGPCADSPVYISKSGADKVTDADKTAIRTDADGKFTVSFDKPGTYIVSARYYADEEQGTRIASNAYCKVSVVSADMASIQVGDQQADLSGGKTDAVVLTDTDTVTLTATAQSPSATINGQDLSGKAQEITLENGSAAVELLVADGTLTKTYTLKLYNKAVLSDRIAALPKKGASAAELLGQTAKDEAMQLKTILETLSSEQKKEIANAADVESYLAAYDEMLPHKDVLEALDSYVKTNVFIVTSADGKAADLTKVTGNLVLKSEKYSAVWTATSEWVKIEGDKALVTRPAYGQPDAKVTLTVTLTDKNVASVTRVVSFEMTIPAQEKTENGNQNPGTGAQTALVACLLTGAAALAVVLRTRKQKAANR